MRLERLKDFGIALLASMIISASTLFVMQDNLKYYLYAIEVILILMIHSLTKIKLESGFVCKVKLPNLRVLDILVITIALTSFLNILIENPFPTLISFSLATFSVLFIPGYVITRIFKFKSVYSGILIPALSIPVSILIMMLASLFLNNSPLAISLIYTFLTMVLVIARVGNSQRFIRLRSKDIFDFILLMTTVTIIMLFISTFYPRMSNSPYNDIVRHYPGGVTKVLMAPDLITTMYPAYYFFLASLSVLSKVPYEAFQKGLAYLSLLPIFSFFIMIRKYTEDYARPLAGIATLFFSLFAGLGWTFVLKEKLISPSLSDWSILNRAISGTFFDTFVGGSLWLWIWFRPLTLSFFYYMILLYLLKEKDHKTHHSILLIAISQLTIFLIHVSEAFFFTILLTIMILFSPFFSIHREFRVKEAIVGLILAYIAFLWIYMVFDSVLGFIRLKLALTPSFLIFLSLLVFPLLPLQRICSLQKKSKNGDKFYFKNKYFYAILALIYYSMSLLYFYHIPNYYIIDWKTLSVPWFFYPIFLGTLGILTIIALLFKNSENFYPLWMTLIAIIPLTIFLKLQIFAFPERRIVLFAWVTVASISALSFLRVIYKLRGEDI